MSEVARVLQPLSDWLAGGGGLIFLTDFDGTLAPMVSDPGDVELPSHVRAHLGTLARSPSIRMGIISGRDLRDLRTQVGVSEAIYAGCHGLEIEGPGIAFRHPEAVAQEEEINAIAEELGQRAESVPGMRVEPKRLGVAIHYRHVAPETMRHVEMELARAIQRCGSRLKIFHGTKVIEVLPQVAWHKGHCAAWIRDHVQGALGRPALTLYMGDEWTDEHAFETLAGQAITVRIGDQAPVSRAEYRLGSVAEVHDLLAALADQAAARGTP
ncbi:MAG TPA: trehalose-phosphatase [Methylomirabilota bacterium]|nr:trehalose-phosphatase [Methylomirabilota bacterium]